ncbi:hypothetical protein CC80DRAFT_120569 [Byssothecium circinans]|uniref:Uncharacterized protein n=1 Tax=Byssothecium circinans TaxID=147558 RepID=A0A6A5U008_9PLEO|nr:hypothetical protein CC80DRAFT_120569 [Byssothecium circinans]
MLQHLVSTADRHYETTPRIITCEIPLCNDRQSGSEASIHHSDRFRFPNRGGLRLFLAGFYTLVIYISERDEWAFHSKLRCSYYGEATHGVRESCLFLALSSSVRRRSGCGSPRAVEA